MRVLLFLALVIGATALNLAMGISCEDPIEAQPSEGAGDDDGLCLARLCVREANWHSTSHTNDCAVIFHIVRATSEEGEGICARLARVGRQARPARAWADRLPADPNAGPPPGWPESEASWEEHRPRWRETLTDCRRWVRSGAPRPCNGWPRAWGMPQRDDARMARRNERRIAAGLPPYVPLDCGPTRNTPWGLR